MKKSDCTPEQWEAYKSRQKAWREANVERERARQRASYHKPKIKERQQEYRSRPDVKARKNALDKARREAKRQAGHKPITPEQHEARMKRQRIARTGMCKDTISAMLDFQAGRCAVCERPFDHKQIRADHCHDSGEPRGLLCHHCNIIEGMIRSMKIRPTDFCARLEHYLNDPPFRQFKGETP